MKAWCGYSVPSAVNGLSAPAGYALIVTGHKVRKSSGNWKGVKMKQTMLDWHAPEDEPMDGAEILVFCHGELFKARYDGYGSRTVSHRGRIQFTLEEIDARAYAPTASEVLSDD